MCREDAAPYSISLAAVLFVNDVEFGMVFEEFTGEFEGAVCAAVLDDDHLAGIYLCVEERKDPLEGARQTACFVMGRDDNG